VYTFLHPPTHFPNHLSSPTVQTPQP
jgi:hypothetical protein